jgi:hypothetical protein
MHVRPWQLRLAIILLALSATVYLVHYLIYRDLYYLGYYFLIDLAFVFISVLLVVVIVEQVLEGMEKRNLLAKVNQVIGVFFSEVGLELLILFLRTDRNVGARDPRLIARTDWGPGNFIEAERLAGSLKLNVFPDPVELGQIRSLLQNKRDFLVRLMENPNLLEHDRFTDLLQAILHLSEELEYRDLHEVLPPSDLAHLAKDCQRIYRLLLVEWFEHLRNLKENYPHLYSLAVRVNPISPRPSAVVTE